MIMHDQQPGDNIMEKTKNSPKADVTPADTSNHEQFLQGYREHKKATWKKAIFLVPAAIFIAYWFVSTTAYYQSLPTNAHITIFVTMAVIFIIAGILNIPSRKCPSCAVKMKKLEPPSGDGDTTIKYYCEQCRVWVNTSSRNYSD
jgi:hypothetical protein